MRQNRLQNELRNIKDENDRLQKVLENSLQNIQDKDNQLAALNNERRKRNQAKLNHSKQPGVTSADAGEIQIKFVALLFKNQPSMLIFNTV